VHSYKLRFCNRLLMYVLFIDPCSIVISVFRCLWTQIVALNLSKISHCGKSGWGILAFGRTDNMPLKLAKSSINIIARCHVLTVTLMKGPIFWHVIPCRLVYRYWHIRGVFYLHLQDSPLVVIYSFWTTLNIETASSYETLKPIRELHSAIV